MFFYLIGTQSALHCFSFTIHKRTLTYRCHSTGQAHRGQPWVQYIAQGHFNKWQQDPRNQTTNPRIAERPLYLSSLPQLSGYHSLKKAVLYTALWIHVLFPADFASCLAIWVHQPRQNTCIVNTAIHQRQGSMKDFWNISCAQCKEISMFCFNYQLQT